MPRLQLFLSYDGSEFQGWQRQTNTDLTVQGILEHRLSKIANARVAVVGSGRTDAGVHARIQVAHCEVPESVVRLAREDAKSPLEQSRLLQSLNSMLPRGIRVFRADVVSPSFHAIRDVRKKTYVYFVDTSPVQVPELRRFAWSLRFPLDWSAIREATRALEGRHDFRAFCAAGSTAKTTVRTIYEARWGDVVWRGIMGPVRLNVFRITGSGFLRNMVRGIVGTLVNIGNGRAPSERVSEALRNGARSQIGPTAPAHGLWLWDIQYPPR